MTFRKKFLQNRGHFQDLPKIWASMWRSKGRVKIEGDFMLRDSVCPVEYLYKRRLWNKFDVKPVPPKHIEPDEFRFTERARFLGNGNHSKILTNSKKGAGIPESFKQRIQDIIRNENFQNSSNILNSISNFANISGIDDDLLPKRINPNLREQNFVREKGTPPATILQTIIENLLINSDHTKLYQNFPDIKIHRKVKFEGELNYTHLDRILKYQFEIPYLFQISSELESFTASYLSIEPESPSETFTDDPFIDLGYKSNHDYPEKEKLEFIDDKFSTNFEDIRCQNPYGLLISNCKDSYDYPSRFSRALMILHLVAINYAEKFQHTNGSLLKNPIKLFCIHTDAIRFHIIWFQLNTLDLSPESNKKNYFWVDDYNYLYEKHLGPKDYYRDATINNFSNLTAAKIFSLLF
ncbi:MAG: 39S ribosomal protein L37, mitochondrial [Marteilia pararefringens]